MSKLPVKQTLKIIKYLKYLNIIQDKETVNLFIFPKRDFLWSHSDSVKIFEWQQDYKNKGQNWPEIDRRVKREYTKERKKERQHRHATLRARKLLCERTDMHTLTYR